jgi:hypothetical protein
VGMAEGTIRRRCIMSPIVNTRLWGEGAHSAYAALGDQHHRLLNDAIDAVDEELCSQDATCLRRVSMDPRRRSWRTDAASFSPARGRRQQHDNGVRDQRRARGSSLCTFSARVQWPASGRVSDLVGSPACRAGSSRDVAAQMRPCCTPRACCARRRASRARRSAGAARAPRAGRSRTVRERGAARGRRIRRGPWRSSS